MTLSAQVVDNPNAALKLDIRRLESEIRRLQSDVSRVRRQGSATTVVHDESGIFFMLILYGAFCALWAQNTGRSAWQWFFAGLFLNVLTIMILLSKNAEDRRKRETAAGAAKPVLPDDLA
jgi:hypothetical protein